MAKRKWVLMFRKEDGQNVWLYEALQQHDLNARKRQGWRLCHS
ncbi:hypothetical protein [Paenisporosarcina sp. TG-14]|nr:hypothetical protein [Paenisporosarcina sp. TG-14]